MNQPPQGTGRPEGAPGEGPDGYGSGPGEPPAAEQDLRSSAAPEQRQEPRDDPGVGPLLPEAGSEMHSWFGEPALPPVSLGEPGPRTDNATRALAGMWDGNQAPPSGKDQLQQPPPASGDGPSEGPSRRSPYVPLLALFAVVLASVAVGGFLWGRSAGGGTAGGGHDGPSAAGPTTSPSANPMTKQARAVDALLDRSTGARDKVITAVVNTRQCKHARQSVRDLRAAARKRDGLVADLRRLDVSRLPGGERAVAPLRQAWKRSAAADRAFAAWAAKAGSPQGCTKGTPVQGKHYRKAVRRSGDAGAAKERFVRRWNPIAVQAGLPKRSEDQI